MYEEDRIQALAMYNNMFDETDDQTGLLQLLVSPTRQAVNLARSYDARERKLQAHAQTRAEGETAEEEPAFIQVIDRIREQAAALGSNAPKVSDDQFSLFEDAALDTSVFDDVAAQLEDAPDDAQPVPVEPEPARYPDEDAEAEPAPDAEPEEAPENADGAEIAEPDAPEEGEAEPAPEEVPAGEPEQEPDAVDAFLADFSIADKETAPGEQPASFEDLPDFPDEDATPAPVLPEVPKAAPAAEPAFQAPAMPEKEPVSAQFAAPRKEKPDADELPPLPTRTVRKARVFLLILFILLAIPVTLLCIAILLLPTLLCLALGFAAISLGISGLVTAFGSFSVFADILLVLGCALVILAIGLLLAWTFIWFVGGAIPGLIRGVFALGRKWCYKEVEVQ